MLENKTCKTPKFNKFTISGCTVRAYDPTTAIERHNNSLYINKIHYYKIGIGPDEGYKKIWKADDSARSITCAFLLLSDSQAESSYLLRQSWIVNY